MKTTKTTGVGDTKQNLKNVASVKERKNFQNTDVHNRKIFQNVDVLMTSTKARTMTMDLKAKVNMKILVVVLIVIMVMKNTTKIILVGINNKEG